MADLKKNDDLKANKVDGIEVFDNPLPIWWVALFNFTLIFGLGYFVWYHVLNKSSIENQLARDRKAREQAAAAQQPVMLSAKELEAKLKDPKLIEAGRGIYAANCSPCHGLLGEGTVGPNLTDKFWIHGGTPELVLSSIADGIPSMGMVAWEPLIGHQKVEAVTAFVLSLQGSNPPNGKAAQGDEY